MDAAEPVMAEARDDSGTRRPLWMLVRAAVLVAALAFVLGSADWQELGSLASGANVTLLLAAFGLFNVAMFIQGWRWHVLLDSDRGGWPFWRVQAIHFAAFFFDIFAPGKLGSDTYRIAALRRPGRMHHMVISIVGLRLHGLSAGICCAVVAGAILVGTKHGPLAALALGIGVPAALVLAVLGAYRSGAAGTRRLSSTEGAWKTVASHLNRADDAMRNIVSQRRTLVVSCTLVAVYMLTIISVYAVAGRAFDMQLRFWSYLAVVPMLLVAAAVPITIHGRGITEAIAILMWQGPLASREQILLTCLAVGVLLVLQGLVGGLVWVAIRRTERKPKTESQKPKAED